MAKAQKKPVKALTVEEKGEWPAGVARIYDSLAESAVDADLDAAERKAAKRRMASFLKHVREEVEAPGPLSPYEVQELRAKELKFELEALGFELDSNSKEGKSIRARIKQLERDIRKAKSKSKPFRARIKTLPARWQKHWVVAYDKHREGGKPKSEAAALAWAAVKVHCTRGADGTWSCPQWEEAFRDSAKEKARTKKALAKARASQKRARKKVEDRAAKRAAETPEERINRYLKSRAERGVVGVPPRRGSS